MTLAESLTAKMEARLSKPLTDGWEVAFPFRTSIGRCDVCGTRSVFVRINATDCDVWALSGIDGARSDAYGVYCHQHS